MTENDSASDLFQLFDQGYRLHNQLDVTTLPASSKEFQDQVSKAISALEDATRMVNQLSLFSSNESVDEVSTNNLRLLLLPALLGSLMVKSQRFERREVLRLAEVYFKDYLQRINDYQVCEVEVKQIEESAEDSEKVDLPISFSLESAARKRNEKILRYNQSKEFNEMMNELREQIESSKIDVDDEIVRKYYMTMLKRWVNTVQDELESIEMEKPILAEMAKMRTLGQNSARPQKPSEKSRLKPIIIVRNEMQKKIYGLGYPSVPTVSIEDFVSKKIEEGSLSVTNPVYQNSLINWAADPDKKRDEDEEYEKVKEEQVEIDDPGALKQARDLDDWKDEHRRGEGNRKNMG